MSAAIRKERLCVFKICSGSMKFEQSALAFSKVKAVSDCLGGSEEETSKICGSLS